MFLRMKEKKGRHYWYLTKTQRVNGKPRIVWEKYLGTPERLLKLLEGKENRKVKIFSFSYGKVAALLKVSEELGFVDAVNQSIVKKKFNGTTAGEYLLISLIGRIDGKLSEKKVAEWFNQSFFKTLFKTRNKVSPQNLINHLKYLTPRAISRIEKHLAEKLIAQGLTPELLIYDRSNVFTHIQKTESLPQKGDSKDKRKDKNLISFCLATSKEGIPFMHETQEAAPHDSRIFTKMIDVITNRLEELRLDCKDMVLVFDRGNNSQENICKVLSKMHLIGGLRVDQVRELFKIPLEEYSFLFKTSKGNEVLGYRTTKNLFGRNFTVVVAYNKETREKQVKTYGREKAKVLLQLEELKAKLGKKGRGRKATQQGVSTRVVEFIPKHLRSIFKWEVKKADDKLVLDYWVDVDAEKQFLESFGKIALFTDLHNWSSKDIVKTYNSKYVIEDDIKWLKDKLLVPIKPVYHRKDVSIRGHVALCVFGMLFLRYLCWRLRSFKLSPKSLFELLGGIRLCFYSEEGTKKPAAIIEEMGSLQSAIFSYLDLGSYLQTIR